MTEAIEGILDKYQRDAFINGRLSPLMFKYGASRVIEMNLEWQIASRFFLPEGLVGKIEGLAFDPNTKEMFLVKEASMGSINFYRFEPTPISQPGDVDLDGDVDLQDLVAVAVSFGLSEGEPNYNPNADFAEPYGVIGLTDLVVVAVHFGEGVA